jgi:DNA-binding beta-propeller fold protein YncE
VDGVQHATVGDRSIVVDATGIVVDTPTARVFLSLQPPQAGVAGLMLDDRTGAVLGAFGGAPWDHRDATVDSRTGAVVLLPASNPGTVLLDGHTSALIRSFTVVPNALALAVNPRTGHILVTSAGPLDTVGRRWRTGLSACSMSGSGR